MNRLKYTHYDIVFQEVPNEISLVFNISGCPYKCEGCHSEYLWIYTGSFVSDDIDDVIKKYNGLITCVCFMGGDQNIGELSALLQKVRTTHNLKTCVYSGCDDLNKFNNLLKNIDYLKLGKYNRELGGLNTSTTNQRYYKIVDSQITDITSIFYS